VATVRAGGRPAFFVHPAQWDTLMDLSKLTPMLIVSLPLLVGLIDVLLYHFGGNEATISKVMLNHTSRQPLVALSTVYSVGVLVGHLFLPAFSNQTAPTHEIIARMVVVLSPTFYALIIVGIGNGTAYANNNALLAAGQWVFAGYILAAFVAGGVVGKIVLPQHLSP
jgi:hypothetical protein